MCGIENYFSKKGGCGNKERVMRDNRDVMKTIPAGGSVSWGAGGTGA